MSLRMMSRQLAAGVFGVALASGPVLAQTVKYFAWTEMSGECADDGWVADKMPYGDNACDKWHDVLVDAGWTSAGYLTNSGVNQDRFCDPDWSPSGLRSDCADGSKGVDEGTAQMICIHGESIDGHWAGLLYDRGSSNITCLANDDGTSFRVGDAHTDFLHFHSCHSMDESDVDGALTTFDDTADSGEHHLHLMTGFHGTGRTGRDYTKRTKKFAEQAFDASIADVWTDLMYDGWEWSGSEKGYTDVCPVGMAVGATSTEADGHISDDTYDDRGTDPSGVSTYSITTFRGCDPAGADPYGL